MKMSPYGTWALMELDYAIYDGLEMLLKVTKNAKNVYVNILWCKWWWWMSLSLCPLSSVFFYFYISPHFSPPNGLERSQNGPWRFDHCALNVMVLKGVKTVHGGLTTVLWMWCSWKKLIWRHYPPCMSQMVLKAANSVHIHNGLEMSQFWC